MHVDDETRLKHIREAALEALEMVRDATREDWIRIVNYHWPSFVCLRSLVRRPMDFPPSLNCPVRTCRGPALLACAIDSFMGIST